MCESCALLYEVKRTSNYSSHQDLWIASEVIDLWQDRNLIITIFYAHWYFIPRGIEISKV